MRRYGEGLDRHWRRIKGFLAQVIIPPAPPSAGCRVPEGRKLSSSRFTRQPWSRSPELDHSPQRETPNNRHRSKDQADREVLPEGDAEPEHLEHRDQNAHAEAIAEDD